MVAGAPTFDEVAADWLDFADTSVLVAHNAIFDVRFINHEVGHVFPGRRMMNSHICTVSLARRLLPDLKSFRLAALAEHFAVPHRTRHRAGDDARATASVLLRLLEHLERERRARPRRRAPLQPTVATAARLTATRLERRGSSHRLSAHGSA